MLCFCDIAYNLFCRLQVFCLPKMEFGNSTHACPLTEYLKFTLLSVKFTQSRVEIYPDESSKPEVGNDLNRNAEITLYRVRPKNSLLSVAQKCLRVKQLIYHRTNIIVIIYYRRKQYGIGNYGFSDLVVLLHNCWQLRVNICLWDMHE